jgi:cell division protein FtsQ
MPSRAGASVRRAAPSIETAHVAGSQDGRAARMRSRYNRYVRRVMLAVGILLAAVLLYGILYVAGAFPVTQVTVNGAEHLTNEEVAEVAAVPADSTLLRVDTAGIVSRLQGEAWVESAGVTRIPPGTLQLDIRERTIKAVVQVPSKDGSVIEDWAIASDGVWLMKIPKQGSEEAAKVSEAVYTDAEAALHITGVPYGVEPTVGAYCNDANVNNAIDIISGLSDNLSSQVKAVEASGTETTTLTLTNGVQIAFGNAEDIREKERVALQLMQEHENEIAYINVRTPTRPTWRGLM